MIIKLIKMGEQVMNSSLDAKRLRAKELILVVSVALVPRIFSSTYIMLTGTRLYNLEAVNALNLAGIISRLTSIAVLAYVLSRQGRNLAEIGFSFRWKDIPVSMMLGIAASAAYIPYSTGCSYIYHLVTGHVLDLSPKNIEFLQTEITIWSLLVMLVNPFYEELIVRAYVMSEVEALTRKRSAAVILSVGLQTSYHLYQGVFSAGSLALAFLIFSLYYIKSKRITPIILAHMYFDFHALISYSKY